MASGKDKRICLGVIIGASGVRGEVKIRSYTAAPEDVGAYGAVEVKDGTARFEVTVVRLAKDAVVARLEGVEDRDGAEALKGTELYVDRANLPAEEEEEYYHADLIGLNVEDLGGKALGTVLAVHDFGAGEMLELELEGGKVAMMPFTREAVPQILVDEGRIIIDPPDGVMPEPKPDKPGQGGAKSGKRKVRQKGDQEGSSDV